MVYDSDGKIDSNQFGEPNQFESIRSAKSIWLIIDYYTIQYTILYTILSQ